MSWTLSLENITAWIENTKKKRVSALCISSIRDDTIRHRFHLRTARLFLTERLQQRIHVASSSLVFGIKRRVTPDCWKDILQACEVLKAQPTTICRRERANPIGCARRFASWRRIMAQEAGKVVVDARPGQSNWHHDGSEAYVIATLLQVPFCAVEIRRERQRFRRVDGSSCLQRTKSV